MIEKGLEELNLFMVPYLDFFVVPHLLYSIYVILIIKLHGW